MGIFVGWIVQRRWLTLGAVLLCLVGLFIRPWLPAPLSYLVWLAVVLLPIVVIYEGLAGFGIRLSSRLRLVIALWMGFSCLVLMVGLALAGSNTALFVASVAASFVLAMSGILALIAIVARRARRERSASAGGATSGQRPTS